MGHVKVKPGPPIFVGAQPKPMNLTYICWFRVPTNIFQATNELMFPIVYPFLSRRLDSVVHMLNYLLQGDHVHAWLIYIVGEIHGRKWI
jgi:hypothetical protein